MALMVSSNTKLKAASFIKTCRDSQVSCMVLQTSSDPGISAFPEGDNILQWVGTIKGSQGTVYEGLTYKLSFKFPPEYPFKAPTVKFETYCFHPNVDQFGNICLDILKVCCWGKLTVRFSTLQRSDQKNALNVPQDKWSSAYDVRTILLSIQSLLGGNGENVSRYP